MAPAERLGISAWEFLAFVAATGALVGWVCHSNREVPQALAGRTLSDAERVFTTLSAVSVDIGGRDLQIPARSVLRYVQSLPQGAVYRVEKEAHQSAPGACPVLWVVVRNRQVVGFYAPERSVFLPAAFAVPLN